MPPEISIAAGQLIAIKPQRTGQLSLPPPVWQALENAASGPGLVLRIFVQDLPREANAGGFLRYLALPMAGVGWGTQEAGRVCDVGYPHK